MKERNDVENVLAVWSSVGDFLKRKKSKIEESVRERRYRRPGERRGMLLPSKLVCHRVRLSQPALMIKIVSVLNACVVKKDVGNCEKVEWRRTWRRRAGNSIAHVYNKKQTKAGKKRHAPKRVPSTSLTGNRKDMCTLLRSDTSNWLWNVSSHITAILMMWPAESIVVKIFDYLFLNRLNR